MICYDVWSIIVYIFPGRFFTYKKANFLFWVFSLVLPLGVWIAVAPGSGIWAGLVPGGRVN